MLQQTPASPNSRVIAMPKVTAPTAATTLPHSTAFNFCRARSSEPYTPHIPAITGDNPRIQIRLEYSRYFPPYTNFTT